MKSGTESDSVLHRRTRSGSAQSALEKDATWKRPNLEDASCLVRSRSLSKTELHERCDSFKNLAVLNMSTDGMARAAVSSEDAVHVPLRRAAVDHVGVNIPTVQAAGGASNQTECRNSRSSERTTSVWVLATAGIAVLALGVTLLILHKQVSRAFSIAVAWMRRLPWPIRLLSYATMYIILAALEFPAWLMAIGAGMLFGLVSGIGLALACHLAAAILCLYTSRYFLRERMERLIETSARRNTYLAVNRALSRQALRFITLMRLSPLFPFALSSMAMGVSQVQIGSFCAGTILGILPGIILLVSIGAQLRWSTTQAERGDADVAVEADVALSRHRGPKIVLRVLSLGSLVLLLIMITRAAHRAIQDELDADNVAQEMNQDTADDAEHPRTSAALKAPGLTQHLALSS
ncbi:hypothetical protein CCYA_CCYA05G1663 [Cyanidiococcus yangmingshanensis]|nr:hypothetical protein CCYA_CCYA05G1663 [Cyanidiococcus yangmingshanensis]